MRMSTFLSGFEFFILLTWEGKRVENLDANDTLRGKEIEREKIRGKLY